MKSIYIEQYGKFGNEALYSIQIIGAKEISKAELSKEQILEMLKEYL